MTAALQGVVTIEIPPKLDYVPLARRLVAIAATESRLDPERIEDVELATSEVVANAVHAQHHSTRPDPITVRCGFESTAFIVEVHDMGGGFLPPDPAAFELREWPSKDTGLGLAIVHSVTDDVVFEDADGGTCAQMRFTVGRANHPAGAAPG